MADAPHSATHLVVAAALLAAAAGFIVAVRNRVIRRRLLFSGGAAVVAALVHWLSIYRPASLTFETTEFGPPLELLVITIAIANGAVALLFNPWFRDGESDRAPAIVQDTLVIAAGLGMGLVLFHVSSFNFLTGSAIVAAVVGFALQDTLGNAFAGIALQIERPFRVGHWIVVGEWVGVVTEVTWRATRIRTKAGNIVSIPNSVMSNHAITNYSEPTAPTRMELEVGVDYGVPPNEVRDALLSATRSANLVLTSPAPEVILADFGASAVVYRVWFWIEDFSRDETAKDSVRTRVYYEFRRRGIEIPWPIQIQYERQEPAADSPQKRDRAARAIAAVPVLARLPDDAHAALAASAREVLFADGEVIVREQAAGRSMFVVLSGRVGIIVGAERKEVATTEAGGYFGEMSLLTGEPRTATVVARGDCALLELDAEAFRSYVQSRPEVIDELALAAAHRRKELEDARGTPGPAPSAAATSIRARMREFFGLL